MNLIKKTFDTLWRIVIRERWRVRMLVFHDFFIGNNSFVHVCMAQSAARLHVNRMVDASNACRNGHLGSFRTIFRGSACKCKFQHAFQIFGTCLNFSVFSLIMKQGVIDIKAFVTMVLSIVKCDWKLFYS